MDKKFKIKMGIGASALAAVMFMQSLPMNILEVVAEEIADSLTTEEVIEREFYTGNMVDAYNIGNGYILQEIEEHRTPTTKEFLMSDDTVMVQQFVEPVHYCENGKYIDIDNSLVETVENGKTVYKNSANSFKVKFDKEQGSYIGIEEGEYSLNVGYKGESGRVTKSKIVNSEKIESGNHKELTRPQTNKIPNGQITYSAIDADTDFVYEIKNNKLSNNIVIGKNKAVYSYAFKLQSKNLQFEQSIDGNIYARNALGQTKFVMPVPYMVDANDTYSNAIAYTLEETDAGAELILTADATWINECAKLPVTITPEIKSATNNRFEFVNVHENGDIITNADKVYAGKKNGSERSDAFLSFKLPSVEPYYQLIGASVNFEYQTQGMGLFHDKDLDYDVYVAESTSDLSAVTYSNNPTKIQELNGIERKSQHSEKTATYESDIINTNNLTSNTLTIGIETAAETSEDSYIALSTASETTSVLYWYQRVIGIEDEYSMESFDISGATSYVNNGSGFLTTVFDLASVNTLSDMPFEVSLVYNDYYDNVLADIGKTSIVGNNFKLNFQQFFFQRTDEQGKTVYELIDADGSISTFYALDSGLYYSKEVKLYYNPSTGIVYDLQGNQMLFINGRLSKIVSENNPAEYIQVVYENATTDQIRQVDYYENNALKYTISFGYTNGRITSVTTNVDSTTPYRVLLDYDDDGAGNLEKIINQTGFGENSNDGVQMLSLYYYTPLGSSRPVGMLNGIFNNQKEGLQFNRYSNEKVHQVCNMSATNVNTSDWRYSSYTWFSYYGSCTAITYYTDNLKTGAREVSFTNDKKVISEWSQDCNGIVSVQATTNWRNEDNSQKDYKKETGSYYHNTRTVNDEMYGLNSLFKTTINASMLGVEDNENYRYAILFKVRFSHEETAIQQGLQLTVKIGNGNAEDIILSQGGDTYICVPCDYYLTDTEVQIRNLGAETIYIEHFYYTLMDIVTEKYDYDSSIKAHKLISAHANLQSGRYISTSYDDNQRISSVETKSLDMAANEFERTNYAYCSSGAGKGKIQSSITKKYKIENDEEIIVEDIETINYTYDLANNIYKEIVTTTQGDSKTRTVNTINKDSYIVEQTDENNIKTTGYYDVINGDIRLEKVSYANTSEEYAYNNLGQITNITVKNASDNSVVFSQTDHYDENGVYMGSSYGGTKYSYGYDATGYVTSIGYSSIGTANVSVPMMEYSYYQHTSVQGNNTALQSNRLASKTYANGAIENYTYYSTSGTYRGVLYHTKIEHGVEGNDSIQGTYIFARDINGGLVSQSYTSDNTTLVYDYGDLDNLNQRTLDIDGLQYHFEYTNNYDVLNNRIESTQIYSLTNCTTIQNKFVGYTYDTYGRVSGVDYDSSYQADYAHDRMGRLTNRTVDGYDSDTQNEEYRYHTYIQDGVTYTTNQLSCIDDQTSVNNDRTTTYDANGYVTGISYNGNTYAYEYDSVGRLTKETKNGVVTNYSYNSANNITQAGNKTFVYDAQSRLVQVGGDTFSYDAMGNPTIYKGNVFVWEQGRKLTSGTLNNNDFEYDYDGNGMRFRKVVNNATTEYYYNGDQLIMESRNGLRIYYIYGETGIEGLIYGSDTRGIAYSFDKNTLGDIVALRDEDGNVVATYEYDAWGNVTVYDEWGDRNTSASFIGNINPIRYRGYYYDTETGFYYLQTRYYDPSICRFINADNYELVSQLASSKELNMYAYCGNNPIMYTDETGEGILTALLIGVVVGAILGGIDGGITAVAAEQDFWLGFGAGAIGGAIGGGLAVTLGWADFGIMSSNVASLIGRGVSSTIYNFTNEWFQSGTITTDNLGLYAADVMMDLTFSMLYIDYFNNGISNNIVGMILGGATDSFVDISQTFLYFSPTAQRRIRTGN